MLGKFESLNKMHFADLEYEDDEIHALLYALLELKEITPYRTRLVSYQQANPPRDYIGEAQQQFTSNEKERDLNLVIFQNKDQLFINLYPSTLPQIIPLQNTNGTVTTEIFFDFEDKLKEALFELQNYIHENNPNYQEIIFTVPINIGNWHWVEGTIKINAEKKVTVTINDPMDVFKINNQKFIELREIINRNLKGNWLDSTTSIENISFEKTKCINVQKDVYCGGATRRMRDATLFGVDNNPYDWKAIDLPDFEISTEYNNSQLARKADLLLLLSSDKEWIREIGQKLLNRYLAINNVLENKTNIKKLTEIYNQYHKHTPISIDVLQGYAPEEAENELIKNILKDFEELARKLPKDAPKESASLKHKWLTFCFNLGYYSRHEDQINKINELLYKTINFEANPSDQTTKDPLICYNMVPSEFSSIDKMTAHLFKVAEMGFTTVWINPIQETSELGAGKTDKITGQTFQFVHSLYAMRFDDRFDPRISTVKRDITGFPLFTEEQLELLKIKYPKALLSKDELQKEIETTQKNYDEEKLLLLEQIESSLQQINVLKQKSKKKEKEIEEEICKQLQQKVTVNLVDNLSLEWRTPEEGDVFVCLNPEGYIYKTDNSTLVEVKSENYNSQILIEIEKQQLEQRKLEEQLKELSQQFETNIQEIQQQPLELIKFLDALAIKKFTDTAKSLGITPIFDLVLNHVAKDSPLVKEHPNWFKADESFKDAMGFCYNGKTLHDLRSQYSLLLYPEDKKVIDVPKNTIIIKRTGGNQLNCFYCTQEKISNDNQTFHCKQINENELCSIFTGLSYDIHLIEDENDIEKIPEKCIYLMKDKLHHITAFFKVDGKIEQQKLDANNFVEDLTFQNEYYLHTSPSEKELKIAVNQEKIPNNTVCLIPGKEAHQVVIYLVQNGKLSKPITYNGGHTTENKPNLDLIVNGSTFEQAKDNFLTDRANTPLFHFIQTRICGIEPDSMHKIIKFNSNIDNDINLRQKLALQLKGKIPIYFDDIFTFPNTGSNDTEEISTNKKRFKEAVNFIVNRCFPNPIYKMHDEINLMMSYWKNYIDKYIDQYGFSGVRVDAIRKLPKQVRRELYDYIKEKTQNQEAVILEELLFTDDRPLEEVIEEIGSGGGKYVTGSVFYKRRGAFGELPHDILKEQGLKNSIVSYGTINFTGNHDHTPAANEVLMEMAEEDMFQSKHESIKEICEIIKRFEKKKENVYQVFSNKLLAEKEKEKLNGKINYYKCIGRFHFMQAIKQEIQNSPNGHRANELLLRLKDKIALNMFSGSGGYYLLCGDEIGNMVPTEIYLRQGDGEVYPRKCHVLLDGKTFSSAKDLVIRCIEELAKERLIRHKIIDDIFIKANEQEQKYLLAPFVDFITHAINGDDVEVQEQFKKLIEKHGDKELVKSLPLKFNEDEFVEQPHFPSAQSSGPINDRFDLSSFIKENNAILKRLPRPKQGAWAHSFKLADHVVATIKINDMGFTAPANIIITNLDPHKQFIIDLKVMKQLTHWMQKRCFPDTKEPDLSPSSQWSQCWHLIMGDALDQERVPEPIFYTNSGIIVDDEVRKDKQSFIIQNISEQEKEFTFVGQETLKNNIEKFQKDKIQKLGRTKVVVVEDDDNSKHSP